MLCRGLKVKHWDILAVVWELAVAEAVVCRDCVVVHAEYQVFWEALAVFPVHVVVPVVEVEVLLLYRL